jgi:hypothetical protein
LILGIVLPIVNVDLGKAGYQQLQFLFVENGDEVRGDDIMEA